MRYLIVPIMLCMTSFIIQAQEYTAEYKMVCKRVTGCPVVNGTCPTCEIVGKKPRRITKAEFKEWGRSNKLPLSVSRCVPWLTIPKG